VNAPETRIVMFGTGDFALPTFVRLLDEGFRVVALVTQPDRPQGRRQELIPSAIKVEALRRGLPVEQPEDVNADASLARIADLGPDLFVTAAYGQILSGELLSIPPMGGINLHGSILPRYRGAAPVARAIERGEVESGVTVIRMTPRIDAGGMIAVARTPIGPEETAGELEARLAEIGAPLVAGTIRRLVAGEAEVLPQAREEVTKAPKLRKEDGRIDWSRPARAVHDLVRAMQPWPSASTHWFPSDPAGKPPVRLIVGRTRPAEGSGEPGRVVEAGRDRLVVAAGEGGVELLVVQPPGKKPMPIEEFLRGHRVQVGDRFGDLP
jgi:methionyl-tRNA formyltransferase